MALDQALVDAAIELAERRFSDEDWAGAAALRLDDAALLTSTAPQAVNPSVAVS